jgi:holo-[acyl-carrier protein] synthase
VADGPVIGTGIDLVENGRMEEMIRKWGARFKDRVFLAGEQSYCETKAFPFMHYAARFAVKEAVSKAFGTGIGAIALLDIEVVRNEETGAPSVRLGGQAEAIARASGVSKVLISLSHTRDYSVANALLIGDIAGNTQADAAGMTEIAK